MSKTSVLELYPSAAPTARKDHFRQDMEDRARRRWALLLGLALAGVVGGSYALGGQVVACIVLGAICFQICVVSLIVLPRTPTLVRDVSGQRYQLSNQQDLQRYARRTFIPTVLLLIPAVFVLSLGDDMAFFAMVFVLGILSCSLAERYRITHPELDSGEGQAGSG